MRDATVQNQLSKPFTNFRRSRSDLPDKERDIDARRTGLNAGRVVAKIATICGNLRFMRIEGRMDVAKVIAQRLGIEATSGNAVLVNWGQYSHSTLQFSLFKSARLSCPPLMRKT